jgi:hypothetical protein
MKPVEAWAIVGPDGEYVAVDIFSSVGAWLAFKWPDECQGTNALIKLGYRCIRVTVSPAQAEPNAEQIPGTRFDAHLKESGE